MRKLIAWNIRGSGTPLFQAGWSSKPMTLLEARSRTAASFCAMHQIRKPHRRANLTFRGR
ncbi:hypothetical protein [Fodinicurvata sp. EGI_FJ10296]|uniref:hypothetical protein n=1 Tax=Fodinicurvata sp. EGI_FJ10296 TaxID=3231908 RepID=UPI003455551F